MFARLKQKLTSKKHRQTKVKVLQYTSDMRPMDYESPLKTVPWKTTCQNLDAPATVVSLHLAPNEQAKPPLVEPPLQSQEKERQEKAAQWIETTLRRQSTLPVYPSLHKYEIIQKLGDGAFSNVYRARDKRTGRNVAIKVAQKYTEEEPMIDMQHLHPNMKKKPRVTERANILKEVQIMRNIHHPNIIQLLQFTESRDNYFMVLDLCEGGELFHRIVDLTYFSEDLARHVMLQLAQAVYHLHEECGVVHRDIKPENILIEPIPLYPSAQRTWHVFDDATKKDEGLFIKDIGGGGIGQVKLADFGLSKIIWDKDTLTPCGTVGYTAPEIVCDQKYSKGVDMWAMGCVLYTMLCGFPPFYDESISTLSQKVARGQFAFLSPWWDPISDLAKDLISGLLCVDPAKRYTVTRVLDHPWFGTPSFDSSVQGTPRSDLTSDTSSTRRNDVFSPASLKEIFDITVAVQRMAEENTHRGESNGHLSPTLYQHPLPKVTPVIHTHGFDLNMKNATLLKNRRKLVNPCQ